MIKWSDVVTIFWLVLLPVLFLLAMVAASREYWLLLGASIASFQIAITICGSLHTANKITTRTEQMGRLISESKNDKSTNEGSKENKEN